MQSRFQVDAIYLVEIQINLELVTYIFLMRDKILQEKKSIAIISNNSNKLLGMRQ